MGVQLRIQKINQFTTWIFCPRCSKVRSRSQNPVQWLPFYSSRSTGQGGMHGFGPLTADAAPRPATATQAGPRDGGGASSGGGGGNTGEEYAWERSYERSWEAVTEDAEGRLVAETSRRTYSTGRTDASLAAVQRGMLRHVFVILDASRGMEVNDLKPSRAAVAASILREFIGGWSARAVQGAV